jgi:putative NADPH-quinone reductase
MTSPLDPTPSTPTASPRTLILLAHPSYSSSVMNRALLSSLETDPRIEIRDLYSLYPDYQIDVAAEQEALRKSDRIVFQFPLYWYSTPALLKLWQDQVLTWGFAFGKTGRALHGKSFLIATTAGVEESFYRASPEQPFGLDALLSPLTQTAIYCGLKPLPPFAIFGGRKLPEEVLRAESERYKKLIFSR